MVRPCACCIFLFQHLPRERQQKLRFDTPPQKSGGMQQHQQQKSTAAKMARKGGGARAHTPASAPFCPRPRLYNMPRLRVHADIYSSSSSERKFRNGLGNRFLSRPKYWSSSSRAKKCNFPRSRCRSLETWERARGVRGPAGSSLPIYRRCRLRPFLPIANSLASPCLVCSMAKAPHPIVVV